MCWLMPNAVKWMLCYLVFDCWRRWVVANVNYWMLISHHRVVGENLAREIEIWQSPHLSDSIFSFHQIFLSAGYNCTSEPWLEKIEISDNSSLSLQIQLMGNPEINSNNPDSILQTVKIHRKSKFFRMLAKQYCWLIWQADLL